MTRKWIGIALGGFLAVAAAVSVFYFSGSDEADAAKDRPRRSKRVHKDKVHTATNVVAKTGKKVKKAKKPKKRSKQEMRVEQRLARLRRQIAAESEVDPSLPRAERNALRGLRGALHDDNVAAAARYATQLRDSASAEVRAEAVQALGWFGNKAISELTGFLSDPDENVASEARMAWERSLSEIEDDAVKLQYIEVAMSSIENADMLDSISMNLNQVSDEKAAVKSMIHIIESGTPSGSAKAREAYEFMTGEEWRGRGPAMQWISEHDSEAADGAGDTEG